MKSTPVIAFIGIIAISLATLPLEADTSEIGKEVAMRNRLADGEEYEISLPRLFETGHDLFNAMWTVQEGAGRPFSKGTGAPLSDPDSPLVFPRNANRISAPDANSCAGCHNLPRSGGGGDVVANVFVLGQRFDHIQFDMSDTIPTRGGVDEEGKVPQLDQAANSRATLGMFGSGYIEMLARQMTADLQAQAATVALGQSISLNSKGVSFGILRLNLDGTWDTSEVEGLSPKSTAAEGSTPPSLIIKPFHQVGAVTSLREFTNNAFNHHHGMQASERFGAGVDVDGDGFVDELSRAEITATSIYQAALPVPGRRIPRYRPIEEAVLDGEALFVDIGCASCHTPALPLDNYGWTFVEPNPYNPADNLQPGDAPDLKVNLNSDYLPTPRLRAVDGVTWVEAYTDLKLHDITTGPDDPNCEQLDQHAAGGSPEFFAGNCKFLTKKLWGAANERPYYHHGKYTTMREAIEAHAGEAQFSTDVWHSLDDYGRDSIIEFLKTLQVLPEGTIPLIVDEKGQRRQWPPAWATH